MITVRESINPNGTKRWTVTVSTATDHVVFTFFTKVEAIRFRDIMEQVIRVDVNPTFRDE